MRLGRYELAMRLAKGGMAEVFLARQAGPAGVAIRHPGRVATQVTTRIVQKSAARPRVVR